MPSTAPPSAPANSSSATANRTIALSRLSFDSSHRCPTGLAPSSPSLPCPEAWPSDAHYSNPPQPSTCPTAAPRASLPLSFLAHSFPASPLSSSSSPPPPPPPPPPSSSSSSSSRPALHRRQPLQPSHLPRSSLPGPRVVTFAALQPAPDATHSKHRRPCDQRPFARNRSAQSTSVSPGLQPNEDLDDFERRLTQGLVDEFAQLALLHESTLLDTMNLARSFTKRLARPTSPDPSHAGKGTRPQISVPMGLISTTNQWVHEVPNISDLHIKEVQQRQISSSSSDSSITTGSDSDTSPSSEPPSMTDNSSVESLSPLEPNHLTPYFTLDVDHPSSKLPSIATPLPLQPSASPLPAPALKPEAEAETQPRLIATPVLPRRAPSHSKREHERLAHARSVSVRSSTISASERLALASYGNSEPASEDTSEPPKSHSRPSSTAESTPTSSEPFSNELKQLDEVAEEFGSVITTVYTKEEDEDHRVMERLGLKPYRVSEYLREIATFRQGLWDLIEEEEEGDGERTPAWI